MIVLDDIYKERVTLILESNINLPPEIMEEAEGMLYRLNEGLSISLSELSWLNYTLDKYELE